ncbi:hypothetical protein BIWAKO_01544 [Bosea sp. BIWAKO-01]|nr:hypothetical protein BIWAKO_01544 [Bosea sp. BIWAKO-01]
MKGAGENSRFGANVQECRDADQTWRTCRAIVIETSPVLHASLRTNDKSSPHERGVRER